MKIVVIGGTGLIGKNSSTIFVTSATSTSVAPCSAVASYD